MRIIELDSARRRIQETYEQRVRDAAQERDADLAALDRMSRFAEIREDSGPPHYETEVVYSDSSDDSAGWNRGELMSLVWDVISGFDPDASFSFHDVLAALISLRPELAGGIGGNAITQVLRRLTDVDHLVVDVPGVGRRPTTYRIHR